MTPEQVIKQRQSLVNDLRDVLEKHKTHIGSPLLSSDVIGAIEFVKLEFFLNSKLD
tara:strand:+ start:404 stop:571 length:168 start_codon:yes stop_codon:yes gene_type:complete